MIVFPTLPAADPFDIFSPGGPINPAFMQGLLETTLATQPLPAGASPERRADHRLATMHAIAAFQPADALEAMLAGQMVAANARMMRCFALAAESEADKAEARRDAAQAASLIRCTQAMRRDFQRQQAARSKDEDQPSERAGYWFRDVSVPEGDIHRDACPPGHDPVAGSRTIDPRACPRALDPGDPMQSGQAASARAARNPENRPPRSTLPLSVAREDPIRREEPAGTSRHNRMQSGDAAPAAAPRRPHGVPPRSTPATPGLRENPVHSLPRGTGPGDEAAAPAGATTASGPPGVAAARRVNPMPSEEHDLPDRMMTGDAVMRFASRRLDPGQSVEAAWAQAEAEAAAEEAEAAR